MNTNGTSNLCGLKAEDFQTVIDGKQTDLYILRNRQGNEVAISNYGGAIVAIMVPDKNGRHANVIQSHDNIQALVNSPEPYLSTLIGRYGNRICKGRYQLNGKVYQLPVKNGPNWLKILNYVSSYGEEGFSGELKVTVAYTFNDNNELVIEYMATTNKKTIVNLTSHGFFSLTGTADPTPTVDSLICEINADFYLPIDETCIPTGEIRTVKDTPFDFRTPKTVGRDIDADNEQIRNGNGYDHCYVLNKNEEGELSFAARITEPESGRTMEVYTTEPGMQLYTDNWADGYKGQHGATFPKRSGICFEAQHFPDSPNRPYFPTVVLRPGEQYKQTTIYRFGVAE